MNRQLFYDIVSGIIILFIFQDDDFDKGSGFLSSTMNRLTAIARSGSNWHIYALAHFKVPVI